jgi:hypothetical protein
VAYTLMSLEMERGVATERAVSIWHRGEPLPHMAEALKEECGCEVAEHSLESLPLPSSGLARRMAMGPGLDLTPGAWRATGRAQAFRRRMITGVCAVVGLWLLCVAAGAAVMWQANNRLDQLERDKEKWSPLAMEVRDMRRRVSLIQRYTDRTYSALECFREICLLQPVGIDLKSFAYVKSRHVKLQGQAPSVDLVYEFRTNLDDSELLSGGSLNGPRNVRGKQVFDITIPLPGGED